MLEKLEELKGAVEEEDFGLAVTLGEDLLTATKDENEDDLTCVVYEIYVKALLHQQQYDKVLALTPPLKSCRSILEPLQAYAMYRLERYDVALQMAQKQQKEEHCEELDHIQAQAFFHLNDTANALKSYQQVLDQGEDHDEEFLLELYTNMVAVLTANATPYDAHDANRSILAKAKALVQSQKCSHYDLAYNVATRELLSAATTQTRQEAIAMLLQAQRACREALVDDPVHLKDELQPLQLNLVWGKMFWGENVPDSIDTNAAPTKLNSLLQNRINPVLLQDSPTHAVLERTIQSLESLLTGGNFKLSPLQNRLCRYNMAALQLQLLDYNACRESLDGLNQSLMVPKKKSNKKPKTQVAVIAPSSDLETIWWQVRVDVLLAYSYLFQFQHGEATDKQTEIKLQEVQQRLQGRLDKLRSSVDTTDGFQIVRDHMEFYLQFHVQQQLLIANQDPTTTTTLEQQFQWLQSYWSDENKVYPAIMASLAKAYQDRNRPEKAKELLLSNGNDRDGNRIIAEMAMAQENYTEAVRLYDQALAGDPQNRGLRARLVEALSHVLPERARKEWEILQDALEEEDDDFEDDDDDQVDGEALEGKELPRQAGTPATGNGQTNGTKRSPESVLRRRAKLRQAHLDALQQRGLYNPAKPTLPDPERWIPKHERQRRRRRGGAANKASQGGVSLKEAAKLDVAARVTGGDSSSGGGGPSTAHLTVAGGSRKGGGRRR